MDIVGIFFYKNNLFTKNLFSSRRKKGEASFSLERGESHLSRVWRYRDVWKNFSPSHSPPFLIVDARTYVIVRNDLPALLEETSRLVWFGSNSRFSLARSEVFIAWKTQKKKKKKEKAVAHELDSKQTSPLLDRVGVRLQIREIPSARQ